MNIKTGATILIITAGVVGGYLIVKNSPSVSVEKYKKNENLSEKISLDKNPIKWVENFISGKNNNSNEINKTVLPDNLDSLNLTEFVAQSAFSGVKQLDESGQNPFDIKNNRQLIQKMISGIQNPQSLLAVSITDKDIKISNDNSKENINLYLGAAAEVISKNSSDIYRNPTDVIDRAILYGNVSDAQKLADIYNRLFMGYLNLEVPSDLKDLHKRYLIIFKKSEILYRGIANFQNDPLKAALFVEMASEVIKEEINIKKEYYNKAVQYGT